MFVAAMQWLNKQYDLWVAKRTPPEEIMSAHGGDTGNIDELRRRQLAEYETILQEWRGTLSTYIGDIGKLTAQYPLTDAERVYIAEVFGIMHVRADVFATLFSLTDLKVKQIRANEEKATFTLETADGRSADIPLVKVVRAWRPNEMGFFDKLGVYFDRAWEFLTAKPREANSEGGILVVIIGTLIMTMLMAVAVVPFGVITALYLREYARQGAIVSAVRIAVNNLAGVPSIVFGIFGLGFFCVIVGGSIDSLWYPELLPSPTFGGGGIMWASLTLALLTIPVVVVATEEALASVPSAQREASLGCGASKFQTIWKVVLPQSMPGILTGTILAMARGAGEVAPLMLVGAVKAAEDLPIDGTSPFVHLERKFMHLGFHVYDLGFQPPDTDKTKPLVFSTALVLLLLIGLLNIFAIRLRNRLRKKLQTSHV
ncbi:MAG: phosphate ABC transporter permease PstA [Planctomycetaceae bacterium]|nr:phosphate ABC transporter permease PstA [Planctomycetaceae bacterium]